MVELMIEITLNEARAIMDAVENFADGDETCRVCIRHIDAGTVLGDGSIVNVSGLYAYDASYPDEWIVRVSPISENRELRSRNNNVHF